MLYLDAYAAAHRAALARRHRPQWSWARLRLVCRCGAELPCPTLSSLLEGCPVPGLPPLALPDRASRATRMIGADGAALGAPMLTGQGWGVLHASGCRSAMMYAMRNALVLGEALIDLLDTEQGAERVYRPAVGGAPLNVAVGIARLGSEVDDLQVEFLGSLGDDALSERIMGFLAGTGVNTRGVITVGAPTALAVTTFDGAEPSFRFYGQPPSYGLFGPADLDRAAVAGAGVFYCGSISLLCEPVLAAARRAWATPGPLRAYDPNVRPDLLTDPAALRAVAEEFATTADLVKLSAADASLLYPGEGLQRVARRLRDLGAGAVVLTLGSEGALVTAGPKTDLDPLVVRAPVVRAVDATGAGDSVMAALLFRLLVDGVPADLAGWGERLTFATRVAGLVCESPGGAVSMPTLAEVQRRFP
jgi:fructokinase